MYAILVILIFLTYAILIVWNFIVFQKKLNKEKLLAVDDESFKKRTKVMRKKYLKNHFFLILGVTILFLALISIKLNSSVR